MAVCRANGPGYGKHAKGILGSDEGHWYYFRQARAGPAAGWVFRISEQLCKSYRILIQVWLHLAPDPRYNGKNTKLFPVFGPGNNICNRTLPLAGKAQGPSPVYLPCSLATVYGGLVLNPVRRDCPLSRTRPPALDVLLRCRLPAPPPPAPPPLPAAALPSARAAAARRGTGALFSQTAQILAPASLIRVHREQVHEARARSASEGPGGADAPAPPSGRPPEVLASCPSPPVPPCTARGALSVDGCLGEAWPPMPGRHRPPELGVDAGPPPRSASGLLFEVEEALGALFEVEAGVGLDAAGPGEAGVAGAPALAGRGRFSGGCSGGRSDGCSAPAACSPGGDRFFGA